MMKMAFKLSSALVIVGLALSLPILGHGQEQQRDPIIIVPGIMGSWNADVILKNKTGGEWGFFPGDKTFDNLISGLEREGFVRGQNLFVAFYDWRKSNITSATDYLVPAIDLALQNSPTGKVDIVAHSMGGLVARRYIQSSGFRGDVDQLVLLGTPNYGSSDVYTLWEGGYVPKDWDKIQRNILKSYLWYMTKATAQTADNYDTIRTHIPSVKELLPIYHFLADKETGEMIYTDDMVEKNSFLSSLEETTRRLGEIGGITVIAGKGQGTVETIPVVARSESETKLWADGMPDPLTPERNNTDGDNRVLLSSAMLDPYLIAPPVLIRDGRPGWLSWLFPKAFAAVGLDEIDDYLKQKEIDSSHGELPTNAIRNIYAALGLNAPSTEFVPPAVPDNIVTFWLASPVDVKITDPQGRTITKESSDIPGAVYTGETDPNGVKMVIIPNGLDGDYIVELTGRADGEYHMAAATFTDEGDEITTVEKSVAEGEKITYTATIDLDNPAVPPQVSEPMIGEPADEEPEPEQTPLELAEEMAARLTEYNADGAIMKKGLYKALAENLSVIIKSLYKVEQVEIYGTRFPKFDALKISAYEKVAIVQLHAFNYKLGTQSGKGIEAEAAADLLDLSKTLAEKIRE